MKIIGYLRNDGEKMDRYDPKIEYFYAHLNKSDQKASDSHNWEGTEREDFYTHLNKKEFLKALELVKTKATRNSLDEMNDLMCAFERAVLGGEMLVIEKESNEKK